MIPMLIYGQDEMGSCSTRTDRMKSPAALVSSPSPFLR